MNYEDTVIQNKSILGLDIPCEGCGRRPDYFDVDCLECIMLQHRKAQAKHTWDTALKEGKQEGRREVAEFIGNEPFEHNISYPPGSEIPTHYTNDCFACRWQDQKKEWGL